MSELIQHAEGCRRPAPQLQVRYRRPVAVCYGCGASAFLDTPLQALERSVADLERRVSVLWREVAR